MVFHFNYWLTGCGSAEVFFRNEHQSVRFDVSYLSDPVKDLIEALLDLLEQRKSHAVVDFFDEPGLHRLSLDKVDDSMFQLDIRAYQQIEGVSEIRPDWQKTAPVFSVVGSPGIICRVIYVGLLDLWNRHGDADYLQQWITNPFPRQSFGLLGSLVSAMK